MYYVDNLEVGISVYTSKVWLRIDIINSKQTF